MVPLDPHQPRRSPALLRDPHHGPASLEQAVTPDHEVPYAELSQERRLRSTGAPGSRKTSSLPRNLKHGGGSFLLVSLVHIENQRTGQGR